MSLAQDASMETETVLAEQPENSDVTVPAPATEVGAPRVDPATATSDAPSRRFTPRAGIRVQLFAAALMWLVGASILMLRGFGYVTTAYWHAAVLGIALALGVVKARYLLDRVAGKAVARIRERGRACFFGFFSWKSWLMVGLMMGGGITLRHIIVNPGRFGSGIMGALYLGVGTALLIADRVFWHAAFAEIRASRAQ